MRILGPKSIFPGIVYFAGYDNNCPFTLVHAVSPALTEAEKLHYHSQDTEYFLVLHGKIKVEVEGNVIEVNANACLETLPKEKHKIVFIDENTEYLVVRTNTLPGEKVIVSL